MTPPGSVTPLVFVTGGVVSSLGKGIAAASLAAILEARGLRVTMMKLDPYINVDPGTMSPFQHGEVYVTDDGAETDLDLGHYERFVNTRLQRQAFDHHRQDLRERDPQGAPRRLPRRHRAGDPAHHRRDQALHRRGHRPASTWRWWKSAARSATSSRCRSWKRSARSAPNAARTRRMFMHLTLVPYIAAAGELKTKPTQHSVKELRSIGIQPDVLLCRSEQPLPDSERRKIALFTNVPEHAVISAIDLDNIYKIPMFLHAQGLDRDRRRPPAPGRPGHGRCRSVGLGSGGRCLRASDRRGHDRGGRQVHRPQGRLQVGRRGAEARRHPPAHARQPEVAGIAGRRARRRGGRARRTSTASSCRAASAIAASRARC